MSVELIVAIAISGTALVGLAIVSVFICSQRVSRSRQAYRNQRASSLHDKVSENAQRYASATQDHSEYSSPPRDFQQPSQHWPLSNAGSPPRTHQSDTGRLQLQEVPSRGQQSCRRFEGSQHEAPGIVSPAESHVHGRAAASSTVRPGSEPFRPTPIPRCGASLPSWRRASARIFRMAMTLVLGSREKLNLHVKSLVEVAKSITWGRRGDEPVGYQCPVYYN